MLLLNRSYVLLALNEGHQPQTIQTTQRPRKAVKAFAEQLIEEGNEDKSDFAKNPTALFSEATWGQLLLLLRFWINDTSKGFEKTDAPIEKSVTVAFEVFDNTRLDTILDLGNLWKETSAKA